MLEVVVIIWVLGGIIANGILTVAFEDIYGLKYMKKLYKAKLRMLTMLKSWYTVGYMIGTYMHK